MASNIKFKSSNVDTTRNSVKESFAELGTIVKEMETKKSELSKIWSSDEATDFSSKLDNLHDMITKFNTKYDNFMSLLDQVYAAYEVDNTNFVLTINSLKDSE
jgi:uncharacterized protein YukE